MYRQLLVLLIMFAPFLTRAQLDRVSRNVSNRAVSKVSRKAESQIDKTIDKVISGKEENKGKTVKKTEAPQQNPPQSNADITTPNVVAPAGDTAHLAYVQFDFVPGEKIIYSNDFSSDPPGEMPVGWNSNGTAAVITMDGLKGNWAQLQQNSVYLTDNKDALTENFTVEFDLFLRRLNPKAPFPVLSFGVIASGDYAPSANELLKGYYNSFATELKIQPYDNKGSYLQYNSWAERRKYLTTDIKKYGELEMNFNKVIHVSMQVQKERIRIWFNETKLYDLPKAIAADAVINQLYFDVKRYGGPDAEVGYTIGNIRIAKGLTDTRHKLVDEGKFSTAGIMFDSNSDCIKPESYGLLREIAGLLNQYPAMKVKITGHTDNDGTDISNLELSKKRAMAVKESLALHFSVEKARLETEGKGEAEPVADNTSKSGKAQNRRVEFVKI